MNEGRSWTYPDGVLAAGADPGRLCQTEEQVGGLVESVDLVWACTVSGVGSLRRRQGLTSMKTVPFWLSPLQYCAGCVLLLTQSGCGDQSVSYNPYIWVDRGAETYVDAPAEGRDARADDVVLADREDLLVLEDSKVLVADRGELYIA